MKKDCVYMDKCYRHGSSLRLDGEELLCDDGSWKKGMDLRVPGREISPGKDLSDI